MRTAPPPIVEVRPGGNGAGSTPLTTRAPGRDLIADELTNPNIAAALGVSVRTLDSSVGYLRAKLGVRAARQIAVWARLTPAR